MTTSATTSDPGSPDRSSRPRLARGAAVGLATAIVGIGSAELVAGMNRDFGSPIAQVGNRVVDLAPPWLKTFAVEQFGTNDKPILLGSIASILAAIAVVLGTLSRTRPVVAAVGASMFGVVGAAASIVGVGGVRAAVPSLVGGMVAVVAITRLGHLAWNPADRTAAVPASAPSERIAPLGDTPTVHRVTDSPAPNRAAPDRRRFLVAATVVVAAGATAGAAGRWLRTRFDAAVDRARIVLPRARTPLAPLDPAELGAGVEGSTPFITPNDRFYRVDTALEVPQVAIDDWTLRIHGMVDGELTFTFDELLDRDLVEADVTLTCVSNEVGGRLAGTARWLGVPLRELLDEAGVHADSDQIVGRSVDGYTCGFPVDTVDGTRTAMVVVGMNGEPLPVEHGFPCRLLVAGLYGYVSATKWLTEIELTRFADFDQYWVPRGWDPTAPIKTFSRIDTPAGLGTLATGTHPIAGVAWAQTRGIGRVEVRVDDSPWIDATLKPVPNDETWCQWVLPWEFRTGTHRITCRATDGNGEAQTEERSDPRPNGASGWHTVVAVVD